MIEVYAFEDATGETVDSFTTQDIAEARRYAMANGYAIIARIFEYSDSELVEDYRPGDDDDDEPEDPEACPGCGCLPGEGYTDGCKECMATVALLRDRDADGRVGP